MNRVIAGEFRKIWQGKAFWIIIAVAIVVNIGYMKLQNQIHIGTSEEQEIVEVPTAEAFKNFDKEMNQAKNKKQFVENYYKEVQGLLLVERVQNYQASDSEISNKMAEGMMNENKETYAAYFPKWKNKDYKIYTDNLESESVFAEDIYQRYSQTKDYDAYLNEIFQQEEEKLGVSIFTNHSVDDFSEKVIRKTSAKYGEMKGTTTDFHTYEWLRQSEENQMTEILILLIIFIIAMYLVFEDKKKNLFSVIRATPRGRITCITSKMITVAGSTLLVSGMMYLSALTYISIGYGLSGMNTAIQSASEFLACPYHLKVWQFLIVCFLIKNMAFIIVALFILLVSMLCVNYIIPFTSGIALILLNVLMYVTFTSVGKGNGFHYLNLWSIIKSERLLGNYALVSIAGNPVSATNLAVILLVSLLIVLVFVNIIVFVKLRKVTNETKKIKLPSGIQIKHKRIRIPKRLAAYEAYKIYRISGCVVIIVLFIGGMLISGAKTNCYLSPNQESYQLQMKELEGKLTEKKEQTVLEKKAYFDDIIQQLEKLEEQFGEGKIAERQYEDRKLSLESKLALYPAFVRVYERYDYVKKHQGARFVYEDGYKKLVGKMDHWYIDMIFIMAMVLIIIQSTVFTMDKERGMEHLIRATPGGRKNSVVYKVSIGVINGIIIYFCFFIRNIYIANRFYGLDLWSASLCNLKGLEKIPEFIPIVAGVLLLVIVQLIVVIVFSLLVMLISKKIGNAIWAIVVQMAVIVMVYVLLLYNAT